jgi:hypothetical protein
MPWTETRLPAPAKGIPSGVVAVKEGAWLNAKRKKILLYQVGSCVLPNGRIFGRVRTPSDRKTTNNAPRSTIN